MKISCTPISFSKSFSEGSMDHRTFCRIVAENGGEGVDILDPAAYPWFWKDVEKQKKELPQVLREYGLRLAAWAAGNHFAETDLSVFEQQIRQVHDAIHDAAEAGAPCLRIFGGYHQDCGGPAGITYDNGLELVLRALERVVPEAEKCGVVLALENHGRLPGLSGEVLALVRHFHSPCLRVLFDAANFIARNMNETECPLRAYERLKGWIAHVHLKDWCFRDGNGGDHRKESAAVAGEGFVPLRALVYEMEKDGYGGYCSLEYEAARFVPEMEGVPKSLRYLGTLKRTAALLFPK